MTESTEPSIEAPAPEVAPVEEPPPPDPRVVAFRKTAQQATWLLVLLVALVGIAGLLRGGRVDLAEGRRTRTSSTLYPCSPARMDCGGFRTAILFHTREEESPWFEVDLEVPTTFSSVDVRNRSDCCQDRAIPLVLEMSDDRRSWTELARRDETFSLWSPAFSSVTARYVRLRVLKRTYLHLEAVNVRP